MPNLFNPAFLKPQNVALILAITLATHGILKPLYSAVDHDITGD